MNGPDAAPSWAFRNLWLTVSRPDTDIAGTELGVRWPEIPRRGLRRRHTEVELNGYRPYQYRHLAISLVLAAAVLILTGCQGLAGSPNGSGTVGVGNGTLDFGTVVIGDTKTLSNTISNNTSASITIGAIQGLGSGFQVNGVTLPLTLAAGQSLSFTVDFKPTTPGTPSATVSFAGSTGQAYVSMLVKGDGVSVGKLVPSPSPVPFGNTKVGSHQTITVTLANNGGTDLTINTATLSGAGFSMGTLALPITVAAGKSASATVTFAPPGGGSYSGSVTFATTSDNINSNVVLNLSGDGASPGTLGTNPTSVAFGNVQVGSNSTKSETLTNTGGSTVTISQASASGAGFSISGLSLPVTLAASQSVTFSATFAPSSAGAASGAISITSDASNSPLSIPLSGTGLTAGALSANPASVSFGSVTIGANQSIPVSVTNTGGTAVTISSASASGAGFSFTGPNLPATLNAGQSATFNTVFTPTTAGTASGSLTINSNASNPTLSVPLSGTGVAQGQLGSNPTSFSFGNVQVGTSKSLNGTLTNSGGTSITISAASASGTGFSLSGLSLPLTLGAGQSTSFTVLFSPTAGGAASGSVSVTSNGSNSNLSIPLSGTGATQGTLSANPTSLSFGSVQVGDNKSLSETLTNSGGSSLTISAASASGSGFSLSGLTLPLTLTAGQSTSFSVTFTPTASGAASGSISITSNGSNSNLSIPLSGTGVTAGTLSSNPTSLAFGNVQVSGTKNLSQTVTNTGGSTVTITQANVTGAGFSVSGLSLPLTLNSNQSVTFTATFAPTSAGAVSGNLAVVSNASNSTLNIALSGTGTAAGTLAVSPTSLSFGSVTVGSSSALTGTLTASGASVTVNSASLNNSEFVLSGISLPVTLNAGQSATFTVTFTPQATGATSASLSFASNASNSPALQSMTGTGTAPVQHVVDLTWNASNNAVGYNIYRSTVSGGPYTMINSSLDSGTAYADNTVTAGQTYYYVATAVDSNSNESAYSSQTQAVVPSP